MGRQVHRVGRRRRTSRGRGRRQGGRREPDLCLVQPPSVSDRPLVLQVTGDGRRLLLHGRPRADGVGRQGQRHRRRRQGARRSRRQRRWTHSPATSHF